MPLRHWVTKYIHLNRELFPVEVFADYSRDERALLKAAFSAIRIESRCLFRTEQHRNFDWLGHSDFQSYPSKYY